MVHTPGANRIGRLIKKYVAQVKDMQKSRGLAWYICYQEKFENQDVAFWHDYGKGGGRRDEGKKDKNCKKILIIFSFLYNMGGCIIKYKLIEKEILGERSIAK